MKSQVSTVPSINGPKSVVPDSEPRARRKQRNEGENLEIDLKGWNYVNTNIQSMFIDEQPSRNYKNDFDLDFNLYDVQSESDPYENFIESQSFDDYILLT